MSETWLILYRDNSGWCSIEKADEFGLEKEKSKIIERGYEIVAVMTKQDFCYFISAVI